MGVLENDPMILRYIKVVIWLIFLRGSYKKNNGKAAIGAAIYNSQ